MPRHARQARRRPLADHSLQTPALALPDFETLSSAVGGWLKFGLFGGWAGRRFGQHACGELEPPLLVPGTGCKLLVATNQPDRVVVTIGRLHLPLRSHKVAVIEHVQSPCECRLALLERLRFGARCAPPVAKLKRECAAVFGILAQLVVNGMFCLLLVGDGCTGCVAHWALEQADLRGLSVASQPFPAARLFTEGSEHDSYKTEDDEHVLRDAIT